MPNLLIIVSAVILMAGLLNFEKNDNKNGLEKVGYYGSVLAAEGTIEYE